MTSQFTYFELHTPNMPQAKSFYGEMFGWTFNDVAMPGMQYATLSKEGGMAGGMWQRDANTPPMWLSYLSVKDVSAMAERAVKLGGKLLQPKTEVPNQGSFAVIADPGGAVLALWQPV